MPSSISWVVQIVLPRLNGLKESCNSHMKMYRPFSAISIILNLLYSVQALTGQDIADHFTSVLSVGSGVYLPAVNNLTEEITPRWNAYNPPTYVVFVKPVLTSDVQKIVSLQQLYSYYR